MSAALIACILVAWLALGGVMKHTPAPWKAGARSVSAPETEDRLGLDVRLYGGNAGDNKANARLIAAAPDMLQALRLIEHATAPSHDDGGHHEAAHEIAVAAIAKAEGRS